MRGHRHRAGLFPQCSDVAICSASTITATPRGASSSLIARAICDVRNSGVCRRRAWISTRRASFDRPTRSTGRHTMGTAEERHPYGTRIASEPRCPARPRNGRSQQPPQSSVRAGRRQSGDSLASPSNGQITRFAGTAGCICSLAVTEVLAIRSVTTASRAGSVAAHIACSDSRRRGTIFASAPPPRSQHFGCRLDQRSIQVVRRCRLRAGRAAPGVGRLDRRARAWSSSTMSGAGFHAPISTW